MSIRLDVYLKELLLDNNGKHEFSRVEIQDFIKNGAVKVNEKIVLKPSYDIKQNDKVDINQSIIDNFLKQKTDDTTLKPKEMDIKIVFENENLIIIDKPAGLSVHPGAGNTNNTLVNGLLSLQNSGRLTLSNERGDMRLGIVHRLDKDTSGLMIVAKNNKSHRFLADLIKEHKIDRRYLALCHGVPVPASGKIENFICRDRQNIEKMKICNETDKGAKIAITNYKVLKTFTYKEMNYIVEEFKQANENIYESEIYKTGDFFKFLFNYNDKKYKTNTTNNYLQQYSLVECKLETGRTHQIRLHMQSIKHPLVGEQIYTSSNFKRIDKVNGFYRQMLHSYKLEFVDVISNSIISLEFE